MLFMHMHVRDWPVLLKHKISKNCPLKAASYPVRFSQAAHWLLVRKGTVHLFMHVGELGSHVLILASSPQNSLKAPVNLGAQKMLGLGRESFLLALPNYGYQDEVQKEPGACMDSKAEMCPLVYRWE